MFFEKVDERTIAGGSRERCWFIEYLLADLCIGDGLGWAIVSDMQKVCNFH